MKYYGQFNPNVDKVLHERYFPNKFNGTSIECGAFDGITENCTKFFEENYNWTTINIEPLPDLIFIEDDTKNAQDLLGKTAHYDPNNKSITLYTLNRHPKDILRSYAHEMIHHKQNLEGRLTNIQGQNVNEDDYLKEIELEAYRDGNGKFFREWENLQ